MAHKILFWIYLVNAILLINHEIESAYWKELELFKLPGGIGAFLLLHFPLLFLILDSNFYHEVHEKNEDYPFLSFLYVSLCSSCSSW